MAIGFIQQTTLAYTTTGATSFSSGTFSATPTAGNVLVAIATVVNSSATPTISFTDSQSNTWNSTVIGSFGFINVNAFAIGWARLTSVNSAMQVTVHASATSTFSMVVTEFTGLGIADGSGQLNYFSSDPGNIASPGTYAMPSASDMVVAGYNYDVLNSGPNCTVTSYPTGYTSLGVLTNATTTPSLVGGYAYAIAPSSPTTPQWVNSTNGFGGAFALAFAPPALNGSSMLFFF